MPLQVTCHECGFVLYDGKEVKAPDEIINNYNGRCPNCRKKLSYIPKRVKIQPSDETK
jgi:predicted Zn-ribbon and HTH transcriptional regulator